MVYVGRRYGCRDKSVGFLVCNLSIHKVPDNIFAIRLISIFIFISFYLGGYKYLHVGKATVPIPLDALMSQPDYVSRNVQNRM